MSNPYDFGEALVYLYQSDEKRAGDAELSYGLTGKLHLSKSGWLLLSVPNALGRGAFDALSEPGAELPLEAGGIYNAHISVMRPSEIKTIPGGAEAISERGHQFTYTLGPVRSVEPEGWDDISKCWFIEVRSPDLEKLRKSYGLTPRPRENQYQFHITFAVRKKHVLRANESSKAASLIHYPKVRFPALAPKPPPDGDQEAFQEKEAATVYAVRKSDVHGVGILATRSLSAGTNLGTALIAEPEKDGRPQYRRTELGRYVNHSTKPNAHIEEADGSYAIVLDDDVSANAEVLVDYHDAYKLIGDDAQFEHGGGKDEFLSDREKTAIEDGLVYDAAEGVWTSRLKALRKRRGECPGCGETFPEGEPYPDVENCERCERFGKPKEKEAASLGNCPECESALYAWAPFKDREFLHPHCSACGYTDTSREGKSYDPYARAMEKRRNKAAGLIEDIDADAAECEEPKSKEQAQAGNYKHGHTRLHGMDITIETGKGMTRKGTDKNGKPWSITMAHHYGYIKRTESEADGDHIDVFIGRNPESEVVFVVDQMVDGKFDEHKCMLGFLNKEDAKAGYLDCYASGWKGCGSLTSLTIPQFKQWIESGDTSKPLAGQKLTFKQAATSLGTLSRQLLSGILEKTGTFTEGPHAPTPQAPQPQRAGQPGGSVRSRPDESGSKRAGFGSYEGLAEHSPARAPEHRGGATKQADLLPTVQLQPHQARVADPARTDRVRKLLFHSLGSGKTLASIAAAENAGGPYLATVPAALRPNFKKEQDRFTDKQTPNTVQSYNALGKAVPNVPYDTAVFDEAHRLRNEESKQTVNAKAVAAKAKNVLLLSGSPVVNRPSDFAPLMEMLTQKPMATKDFESQFIGEKKVNPGLVARLRGVKPVTVPVIRNRDQLKQMLAGHVDYHAPAKPDVEQVDERYTVPMSPEQTSLYQAFWDQLPWMLRWKLQNDFPLTKQEIGNLSSFLAGPRQVSLSTLPFMKGKRNAMQAYQQSPKLQKAMELAEQVFGENPQTKLVAFSNFVEAGLEPYAAALKAKNIPYGMFHGGLSDGERKKVVEDYNSDRLRALLIAPAGSEGLSLRGTTALQLLDPHWNEARLDQAIGRGIRFDSHQHLPVDQRKVRVQRILSELPPGFLQKLWRRIIQTRPSTSANDPGTDTYLENMSKKKQELNDQFLDVLREVGTEQAAA